MAFLLFSLVSVAGLSALALLLVASALVGVAQERRKRARRRCKEGASGWTSIGRWDEEKRTGGGFMPPEEVMKRFPY